MALVPGLTLLAIYVVQAQSSRAIGAALEAEKAAHTDARGLDALESALQTVLVCARVSPQIQEAVEDVCRGAVVLDEVPDAWRPVVGRLQAIPDIRERIIATLEETHRVHAVQGTRWREAEERRHEVDRLMRRQVYVGRASLGMIAVMLVLPVVLALGIRRRTRVLMAGVERLSRGDLDTRIPLQSTDELGVVAQALNQMVRAIEERNDALMRVSHDLAANLDALARAQAQRVAAERMEAIATLAAGLSHEINNPLSYVGANVQFARSTLGQGQREVDEALAEAMEGVGRITSIVGDLRFITEGSRRQQPRAQVDVRFVLEATVSIAEHRFRDRARILTDLRPTPRVLANEGQLGQVFLDLVVHAVDRLPPERADRNALRIILEPDAAGGVVVEIRDNGDGLTAEARARLFEPFYVHPRDPGGSSSALGLSVCKRIVDELGGTIAVESEEGAGTCVRLRLPAAGPATGNPTA